jgi:hypothetical protein
MKCCCSDSSIESLQQHELWLSRITVHGPLAVNGWGPLLFLAVARHPISSQIACELNKDYFRVTGITCDNNTNKGVFKKQTVMFKGKAY